jgi:lysophospholipase L1-like esterase
LLGTRGTGTNKHEGRSGWTAKRYVEEAESASGVKNAFYNPMTNTFDFGYYMQSNGYSGVDCVFVQLGINDVFGARTTEEVNSAISGYLSNMETIVKSIHAYNADIKIVINLIIPSDADQDKFGKAYGVSQTAWKYKKNTISANLSLIDRFNDTENVFVSPFNAAIDTENNMNGDVHPTATGYNQAGEQMYSFMRAIT